MPKDKTLPVFNISDFYSRNERHNNFYLETLQEHISHYQFINAPHRHDFYMIALFTEGEGTHTIDFTVYEVKAGSVFFMSPGQVHSWKLSSNAKGYILFFNADFYLLKFNRRKLTDFSFFNTFTHTPFVHLEIKSFPAILALFERIFEEAGDDSNLQDEIICSYLDILLLKLAGAYAQQNFYSTKSEHAWQQLQQLEMLIERSYKEHKTVAEYAGKMALSVRQLNNICQALLGKPVSHLVQERLVLEAKRLLVHTDLSISQIAAQLNYDDNSYFNRFFKKETGTTPENFRQQFQ